ncbi:hypothetical protein PG990_000633 [Apiospora arundinis]|uniref:Uncharacterized protein n=1 Tax=Apiospora arundinis TaxID=335852 RepID=A0ABR2HZX6_9PEZI
MCGDSSRQSCGGAIAILNPPERATGALSGIETGLSGRLIFQSARDDTLATDAIFTHDESAECSDGALYTIGIHKLGDLTTSAICKPTSSLKDRGRS